MGKILDVDFKKKVLNYSFEHTDDIKHKELLDLYTRLMKCKECIESILKDKQLTSILSTELYNTFIRVKTELNKKLLDKYK